MHANIASTFKVALDVDEDSDTHVKIAFQEHFGALVLDGF